MKRLLLGAYFMVLGGSAIAQSQMCMPGGTCCINGTCGTLEQFQRNAKIVCLQADAIENKTLSQSVELTGRCSAAQIMAQRVESTQQENAKEHQRALEAQRQLSQMGAPLPQSALPASTGLPTQDPIQRATQVSGHAMQVCRAKRLRGELATYAASVQCSNKVMIDAFREARFKYIDLIQSFAERRLELASMVDGGALTEQQEQLEMNKALATIQDIARRRESEPK